MPIRRQFHFLRSKKASYLKRPFQVYLTSCLRIIKKPSKTLMVFYWFAMVFNQSIIFSVYIYYPLSTDPKSEWQLTRCYREVGHWWRIVRWLDLVRRTGRYRVMTDYYNQIFYLLLTHSDRCLTKTTITEYDRA